MSYLNQLQFDFLIQFQQLVFVVRINGTDCRCIFDPINARFASSCSKNGINEAATETT
jgi:hypothetical protein